MVRCEYNKGTREVQTEYNILSPRKKKDIRQHRFNLNVQDEAEGALHSHLAALAETGEASQWVIDKLLNALIGVHAEYTGSTQEVQRNGAAKPIGDPKPYDRPFNPVPKPGGKSK